MPAYVITYLEVTDRERFDVYGRLAGPTFARYGGRPIVVDGRSFSLTGPKTPSDGTRRNTRDGYEAPKGR
jgi:uncharacterized protein (DUF1330 family)